MLRDTQELLRTLVVRVGAPDDLGIDKTWEIIPVRDAYRKWAGWDPVDSWDENRFDEDMVMKIEPNLPRPVPVVLIDYPAQVASLAKLKDGSPEVAERWEVYCKGIELANAYSELCDADAQRARFAEAASVRHGLGKADYPMDEEFFTALKRGMPPSGGIALGVDRLVMLLLGVPDIHEARLFCQQPGHLF